jgi:addiction module RelE/StbE family toxin
VPDLVWLASALDDVTEAFDYLAAANPVAASSMRERLLTAVEPLADMPELGREGRVRRTRELIVSGTPYLVVYRIAPLRVEIIAVRHHARRWPRRFSP